MPAAPRLADPELLDVLSGVFRTHGLEGATLSRISEATGLQRASLYHRFPGGKEEMAAAAMGHIHGKFAAEVLADLVALATEAAAGPVEPDEVRRRVRSAVRRLGVFHEGGETGCLLDTMTVGTEAGPIQEAVLAAASDVRDLFAAAARAVGVPAAKARQRAEDAMITVEGALVVARALEDLGIFRRALKGVPEQLLAPAG